MRDLLERMSEDPVYFAYRFLGYGLCIFLLWAVMGCASTGYLTSEEEAQMRKICGEEKSCTVLSNQEWQQVESFLHRCLGI